MSEFRSRYVPVPRLELVELLHDALHDPLERARFARLSELIHSALHHEMYDRVEEIRGLYAPFDPDPLIESVMGWRQVHETQFGQAIEDVLLDANFRRVTDAEIDQAFAQASLFPLSVKVDLDDYATLILYRRGEHVQTQTKRSWRTLWRTKTMEVETFDRLFMALRMKESAIASSRQLARVREMEPGKIYLKFFKNIPKNDLEMILPNARFGMLWPDRLVLGGSLTAGLITSLVKAIPIVAALAGGAALSFDDPGVRVLGGVLLAIAGYLWRTHTGYKRTQLQYMQTLSEGLYFKNLANNEAALQRLLTISQDEQTKETILAYRFLRIAPTPLTAVELGAHVETWMHETFGRGFEFDVMDGLAKLDLLGLLQRDDDKLSVLPLDQAIETMEQVWARYIAETADGVALEAAAENA